MSTEVGGALLIVPAVGMAACAAAAVLAGGVALGAGYLVIKGTCSGAKACNDAWHSHLEALEKERQERFKRLRAEDEKRLQELQESFISLAGESDAFLKEREAQVRLEMEAKEEKCLAEERRKAEEMAIRQRSELLDSELQELRKHKPSRVLIDEKTRNDYQNGLEKARAKVREREESLSQSITIEPSVIPVTPSVTSSAGLEQKKDTVVSGYKTRLVICRVKCLAIYSLNASEIKDLQGEIEAISSLFGSLDKDRSEEVEEKLQSLESVILKLEEREKNYQQTRLKAKDRYFSLQEKYLTATMDGHLSQLLESPLGKLAVLLERSKLKLSSFDADLKECLRELVDGEKDFDRDCAEIFQSFQQDLNGYAQTKVEKVLAGRGYQKVNTEKLADGSIVVYGSDLDGKDDASVNCTIDSVGTLNIDLSHTGFKNQTDCDREFSGISNDLRQEGVFVELKKKKSTWQKKTLEFFLQQLEEIGYKREEISIEKSGRTVRLVATQVGRQAKCIEIDARKGVSEGVVDVSAGEKILSSVKSKNKSSARIKKTRIKPKS